MTRLVDIVEKVRTKNAGPFWLTVDIFCPSTDAFERVHAGLSTEAVASLFQTDPRLVKRFDIEDLRTVKFSLRRPHVQGTIADRDMHGAAYASLFDELEI